MLILQRTVGGGGGRERERERERKKQNKKQVTLTSSRKDWAEFYECIK